MGFEKYSKQSGRGAAEPRISIRQSETIGINSAAMEEYFEDADGVVLYYDEDTNRVGLEPASKDDSDAYSLGSSDDKTGGVTASGFMRRYDLVPENTTHYAAQWDDETELVYADLDDPIVEYGTTDDE